MASIDAEFKKFYNGPAKAVTGFPVKAAFPPEEKVDPKAPKGEAKAEGKKEEGKKEAAPAEEAKAETKKGDAAVPAKNAAPAAPSAVKEAAAAKIAATPAPPIKIEGQVQPKEEKAAPAKEEKKEAAAPAFAQKTSKVPKTIAEDNTQW